MRSIRLSLVVYFLVLLALALGVVSVLAYRSTQQTLLDKQLATEELIREQCQKQCDDERVRLQNELLDCASNLARETRLQIDLAYAAQLQVQHFWWLDYRAFHPRFRPGNLSHLVALDGSLAALVGNTSGYLVNPIWLAEARGGPFFSQFRESRPPELKLEETELPKSTPEFFQISTSWQATYRSASLKGNSFPNDPRTFNSLPTYDPRFDDHTLKSGVRVHRLTVKVPTNQLVPLGSSGRGRTGPSGGRSVSETQPSVSPPRPAPSPPRTDLAPRPTLLIQCAYDIARRDRTLREFEAERDEALADVASRTESSLAALRNGLLLVSIATFLAAVGGLFLLVRVGLSPLDRLSDAVSKVSERDFALRMGDNQLPSELVPIANRLRHTLDQLRHAFDREKQAAADISHELRTPVAALLTTIDVALRKPRTPEQYRDTLLDCRGSGQQIHQLVERLLLLARLDAGVDHLRVEPVDVAHLAEQCASLVRPLAEARGLSLRSHEEGSAMLDADPAKLREVITNLLHNAIEYNQPDGTIDLTVLRDQMTLRIEVRDTGIGIAPEAREHLFERFYRADPSRQSEGLHAGLGLAIVKGYVDLMGGEIAVESEPGQGSTFRVELPVPKREEALIHSGEERP